VARFGDDEVRDDFLEGRDEGGDLSGFGVAVEGAEEVD
jgi:hypothetical protein